MTFNQQVELRAWRINQYQGKWADNKDADTCRLFMDSGLSIADMVKARINRAHESPVSVYGYLAFHHSSPYSIY